MADITLWDISNTKHVKTRRSRIPRPKVVAKWDGRYRYRMVESVISAVPPCIPWGSHPCVKRRCKIEKAKRDELGRTSWDPVEGDELLKAIETFWKTGLTK